MIDTINTICKEIAPDLNLPEVLVRKVYGAYWKDLKRTISSGKHTSVWIRSIGTLSISRTKVNKFIQKLVWRIRDLKAGKPYHTRKTRAQMIIETIDDLRLMCARRNEIAIAYKANVDRIKAKNAAKTKGHLVQQTSDITGISESTILSQQEVGAGAS